MTRHTLAPKRNDVNNEKIKEYPTKIQRYYGKITPQDFFTLKDYHGTPTTSFTLRKKRTSASYF